MVYRFDGFELDTARHELRRGGAVRHVEPQVFAVLAYLVEHRHRVVPRDELLDAVWGHRHLADATLSGRIKAARRAIGDSGAEQRLIRTVRGSGFRFVGDVGGEPPAPAGPSPPVDEHDDDPVRRGDLRLLRRELTAALAGRRRAVLITGDSGAGKSTLLERFAAEARTVPGARVAVGRSVEHRGPGEPYLPLLDAVARLCEGLDGATVVAVLRRRAPTWLAELPWIDAGHRSLRDLAGTPERMLREMVEAIEVLAAEAPLVLALEDVHWSDPSTIDLLAALARRRGDSRLLVVTTLRTGATAPGNPAVSVLSALVAEGAAAAVHLAALGETEVAAILARRCPGLQDDAAVVTLLHTRTGGNPLFVGAVLEDWVEGGAVAARDGIWRRAASLDTMRRRVPATARLLVEARVGRLPGDLRRALEAGTVLGPEFSSAGVAALLEVPPDEAEQLCARLAGDGGMLHARDADAWPDRTVSAGFAFVHDLYRQVVYDGLTSGRRAQLHARAGLRREAAYGERASEIAAELADHFVRGHDDGRAMRWSLLAAERALARGARREAVAHLRACVGVCSRRPDLPDARQHELAATTLIAAALVALEGWDAPEPRAAYQHALRVARSVGDLRAAAAALFGLAVLSEYRGEYADTQRLLEERLNATVDVAADPDGAAASHELLACSLFHQGAFAAALAHADCALRIGHGHPTPAMMALGEDPVVGSHGWASRALWALDDPEGALERAERAVALARRPTRGHGLAFALVNLSMVLQLRGDAPGVLAPAAEAAQIGTEQGLQYLTAAASVLHGWATALSGDRVAGLEELREGLGAHAATGAQMDRPYFLGLLADAAVRVGCVESGLAAVDEALAAIGPERPFFFESELLRLRAALLGIAGDGAGSEAARKAAIGAARRLGSPALQRRAEEQSGGAVRGSS